MTRIGPVEGLAIVGSGTAFPCDVSSDALELDNAGVYRFLLGDGYAAILAAKGRTVDDPEARFGVRNRQWARRPGDDTAWVDVGELAIEAGRRAMADAGCGPDDIDLVFVATSTPDRITSSLAARVGKALGIRAGCIDLRAGGAGGLYGITSAALWIAGGLDRVLVIGSETATGFVDPSIHAATLLYADGAGAVVVGRGDGALLAGALGAVGAPGAPFTVHGPLPPTHAAIDAGAYRFGRPSADYVATLHATWRATSERMRAEGPVDHFLPYPVTRDQVALAADSLGVPLDRTVNHLADHGCIGCAGPLVSLHEHRGELSPGDVVVSTAVAGGVVWGGVRWRW